MTRRSSTFGVLASLMLIACACTSGTDRRPLKEEAERLDAGQPPSLRFQLGKRVMVPDEGSTRVFGDGRCYFYRSTENDYTISYCVSGPHASYGGTADDELAIGYGWYQHV